MLKTYFKFAALFLMVGTFAHAQRVNTQYVTQFPGTTVAAKTAAAQAACNSAVPCVLIFDADLSVYPLGSLPGRGVNEAWWDYYSHAGQTYYNGSAVNTAGGTPVNNFSAVSHQFLNSFSAPNFTAAQPAFSDLSGNIAVGQMNGGSGASSSTFWRGDGTWSTPPSTGTTVTVATGTSAALSTSAQASGSCTAVTQSGLSGLLSTDSFLWAIDSNVTNIQWFNVLPQYVSATSFTFNVCNISSVSETLGGTVHLVWRVVR